MNRSSMRSEFYTWLRRNKLPFRWLMMSFYIWDGIRPGGVDVDDPRWWGCGFIRDESGKWKDIR
jgi:hypothetical protein